MTFQFGQITAASPLALASAFTLPMLNHSGDSAVVTIRKALDELPVEVAEKTLEEIAVEAAAHKLITTARDLLSPTFYPAFFNWAEAAVLFCTKCEDQVSQERCGVHSAALRMMLSIAAQNEHDASVLAYVTVAEIGDKNVFGPIPSASESQYLEDLLGGSLLRSSPVAACMQEMAGLAHRFSPPSAWAPELGAAAMAGFSSARLASRMQASARPFSRAKAAFVVARDAAIAFSAEHLDGRLAGAEAEKAEAVFDRLCDEQSEAMHEAILAPAESIQDVLDKIRFYNRHDGHLEFAARQYTQQIEDDLIRLTPAQGSDPVLVQAFAGLRREMADYLSGGSRSREEDDASDERVRALEDIVWSTRATTVEGVVAKLRIAFQHMAGESWSDHSIVDPKHPDFVDGFCGGTNKLLWQAIEDLARIGGVNLSTQGAEPIAVH